MTLLKYIPLLISNSNNESITFELTSKKCDPKIVILTLEEDLKKEKKLNLTFKTTEGNNFSDEILVKGKSSIGIIGKYR